MRHALTRLSFAAIAASSLLGGCVPDERRTIGDVVEDQYAVTVCAAGNTIFGIDVSYYQGTIDWAAVHDDGVSFAFIRVSDGTGFEDPKFASNWANAKANGIVRGAYQFFRPGQDVIAEADLLLANMGPLEPGDLPPVLDVEATDGLGNAAVAAGVAAWLDHVEAALGTKPIIYTGKYFWQDNVGSDETDTTLWVAQWGVDCPNLPDPWTEWKFHQTSATGSVSGISGDVDTDLFNGSLADLADFAAGSTEPPPPCEGVPPEGRIIDDSETCFHAGGPPAAIRHEQVGYDDTLQWTYTTDKADEENFGAWDLAFVEGGVYRVEAYTSAAFAESKTARYDITHAGVTETVTLDQTAADGWQVLGELEFAAGGDQRIHVGDNTGEVLDSWTQVVFDGIRLTRVDMQPPVDPGDPEDPMDPMDPGTPDDPPPGQACTVGAHHPAPASSGGLLVLALALGGVWVSTRRR